MGKRALRPVAIVVLAFLPVIVVGASVVFLYTSSARDAIVSQRLSRARSVADAADALVDGSITTLTALAQTPFMRDANAAEVNAYVTEVVAQNPDWFTIGLSSADGFNITSTSAPPHSVNISDRDYFQGAMSGHPTVGSVVIARGNVPAKIIVIAVPIVFSDGSRGVLNGGLRLTRVEGSLLSATTPGTSLRVIDQRGQEFIGPGLTPDHVDVVTDQPDVRLAMSGSSGIATLPVKGVETIVAYAKVPTAGWTVIIRQPAADAFAVPDRELTATLGLAAAGLIGAILVAFVVGRRLERSEIQIGQLALAVLAERDELQQLIDGVPQGITLRRADGTVIANRAAHELVGVVSADPVDIIGTLDARHVDGAAYRTDELPVVRGWRGETVRGDQMIVRAPGSEEDRTLLVSAAPLRRDGAVVAVAAVLQDITELKALEAQRAEFFSIASHEIKTPVTAIHLQLQILAKLAASGQTDRLRSMADRALERSRALVELVTDLLEVSRIEAGRMTLELEEVDLTELVRAVADVFPSDDEHPVAVVVPARPVRAMVDPRRIRETLENLLSNAMKYSPNGGALDVELSADGTHARMRVRDHGFGIPPAEQPFVFDRFFRTRRAKVYSGVGLGLYIARDIVGRHGGSLELESSSDEGSTFLVTLPLITTGPAPEAPSPVATPAYAEGGNTV